MAIQPRAIGSCNVRFIDPISNYRGKMGDLIADLFASPGSKFIANNGPTVITPNYGVIMFIQGSEHADLGYGNELRDFIRRYRLGKVVETGPTPNLLHGNKPSITYLWKLDKDAIKKWCKRYVSIDGKYTPRKKSSSREANKPNTTTNPQDIQI